MKLNKAFVYTCSCTPLLTQTIPGNKMVDWSKKKAEPTVADTLPYKVITKNNCWITESKIRLSKSENDLVHRTY